jgi:nucleoside-diphosphate-sugar epimerase
MDHSAPGQFFYKVLKHSKKISAKIYLYIKKPYFSDMILVTGGTGLVGSHLLYHLVQNEGKVRAIHRRTSDLNEVRKVFSYYSTEIESKFQKIEWFESDILDLPSLNEAFSGVTQVYHAAAYISFFPNKYSLLNRVNVEGTANIVNLSLAHGVKKLCYVSSIATLGKPQGTNKIDEETEFDPEEQNSVYSITKRNAELEVWRGAQEGLDVVIVNPGVVFGSGHWNSASGKIMKMIAKGISYYTSGYIGMVDVQDVAKCMISLMNSEIINQNYILVSKNISLQELLSRVSKHLHKDPPKKEISKRKMILLSNLDWVYSKIFRTKRKLLKVFVNSLYRDYLYDSSNVKKNLGYEFIHYERTLERVAKDYSIES